MRLINYNVLRDLVHEHQRLTEDGFPARGKRESRLADVAYTLGVYTGHRDPAAALREACRLLRAHDAEYRRAA
ncbi:DUF5133 domain-containing protein [Streptomyces paromomycinus]|uniref:DUF5133 domain-containing protein n=1 Tax=Streptomyces paromomycinus TaxID=92743 RepID=A0A401WDF0_STREY|nr:DUF5133 domain-containing protein [Streptomyces paromomycinus]GCD47299.1 hypothetical protein GKJPGBOP_07065 [Streptomyces paromomycinus]